MYPNAAYLIAAIVVLVAAVGLVWYELAQRRHDIAQEQASRLDAARATHHASIKGLDTSFDALRGTPTRLDRVSAAARQAAHTSAACAALELDTPQSRGLAGWDVPAELRHDSPRPGDPEPWQTLDRCIAHLLATLDHATADLTAHAFQRLANAATILADEVRQTPRPKLIQQCWFCGQTADEVRLVVGPHASSCNDCVDICNEVLG